MADRSAPPGQGPPPPPGADLLARNALGLEPGHAVDLVHDGRIFDAIEEEIASARKSVHLAAYIWRPGRASDRVVGALAERARAGVRCRVVVDRLGTRSGFRRQVMPRLLRAGCEVRLFSTPQPLSPRGWLWRNHRKLLVVDGRSGLTGGWCVWDLSLGDGRSPDQWRDVHVRVRGPAVLTMQHAFFENWLRAGGGPPKEGDLPAPPRDAGPYRAAFVASTPRPGRSAAEELVRAVIASARRRLWIASAYFVPDHDLETLLAERSAAGVDVRLLLPGPITDVPLARIGQRSTYPRLLAAGVAVHEYQPSMMHAKTVLADEALAVVGSINVDPLALRALDEGALVVEDESFAGALAASFARDLERSVRVERPRRPGAIAALARVGRRLAWRLL